YLVFPETFSEKTDVFEFLGYEYIRKMPIGSLTIDDMEKICSEMHPELEAKPPSYCNAENASELSALDNRSVIDRNEIKNKILDTEFIWKNCFLGEVGESYQDNFIDSIPYIDVESGMMHNDPESYKNTKEKVIVLYTLCCLNNAEFLVSRLFCEM